MTDKINQHPMFLSRTKPTSLIVFAGGCLLRHECRSGLQIRVVVPVEPEEDP